MIRPIIGVFNQWLHISACLQHTLYPNISNISLTSAHNAKHESDVIIQLRLENQLNQQTAVSPLCSVSAWMQNLPLLQRDAFYNEDTSDAHSIWKRLKHAFINYLQYFYYIIWPPGCHVTACDATITSCWWWSVTFWFTVPQLINSLRQVLIMLPHIKLLVKLVNHWNLVTHKLRVRFSDSWLNWIPLWFELRWSDKY